MLIINGFEATLLRSLFFVVEDGCYLRKLSLTFEIGYSWIIFILKPKKKLENLRKSGKHWASNTHYIWLNNVSVVLSK